MTPLQALKQILQEHLEVCQESEDYKEALLDSCYACDLSVVALEQHLDCWLTVCPIDCDYRKGIGFVNDQWKIIKEKEDEIH